MSEPSNPKVSVVIPCYNGASTLPLQLQALATQQEPGDFEVIVVDNASTDDFGSAVKPYLADERLHLRVVSAPAEQGVSYARNVGIGAARGDRFMFCDADDVVSAWWLKHGTRAFDHATLWSGGSVLLTDEQVAQPLEKIRAQFGDIDEMGTPIANQAGAFPIVMGGNFGATREVLVRLKGFDQSLPPGAEDNDLGFRAHQLGVQVYDAPHVRIGYRGRWDLSARRRLVRSSALAKTLIASRYSAWDRLPMPDWRSEPLRVLASAVRLSARRAGRDEWDGWRLRAAAAAGLFEGGLRYEMLRRRPPAQIGTGWLEQNRSR